MKKFLPILLVVIVGLGVIGGAFYFLTRATKPPVDSEEVVEEEIVQELPLDQKPHVMLVPREDGHELNLTVSKIPQGTASLEYELVYQSASGVTQGVPGTIKDLSSGSSIERKLLLGSCSSGKCKYDDGVEKGTFTLRLRDGKGKLKAKMEGDFHLQKGTKELTSSTGDFSLTLDKAQANAFYIVMPTFGFPGLAPFTLTGSEKPYGVFSTSLKQSGKVNGGGSSTYVYDSSWNKLTDNKTTKLGTFLIAK